MTSRDFGFITLRNAVAYRPDNSVVPSNNVFVTSTNGAAVFTNTLQLSSINISSANINTHNVSTLNTSTLNTNTLNANTINISTANIDILNVSTIAGVNTIDVSTINAKTINSSTLNVNTINISTANIDILNVSTIAGVNTIDVSTINSKTINTSTINTSTITVTSLIALPTATAPSNVLYTATNELYFNGLRVNTGVISTVSTVYWAPAGDGTTGVITNDNEGNPLSNPLRYLVGVGTNFGADTRSTLNGTLDIQYRGGVSTGNVLFVSSNNNTFAVANLLNPNLTTNTIQLNLNNNAADLFGGSISLNKSNNLSASNDTSEIGFVEFRGTDTNLSSMRTAYMISHQQGAAANGYVPGTLEFFTTADLASANSAQRMIISSSGQVGINTPAPYKQLQVSTTIKNALDGIACNSFNVNTIIGAYSEGPFLNDNVGSIQVTQNNNSSDPYVLALNPRGGDIYIGSSIGSTFINGGVTISTLTASTINGQEYDPTQDTHWTGYDAGSGILNVYNANNGAIGIGTGTSIASGVKFQVTGDSLFNGDINLSNTNIYNLSSINNPSGAPLNIIDAEITLINGGITIASDNYYLSTNLIYMEGTASNINFSSILNINPGIAATGQINIGAVNDPSLIFGTAGTDKKHLLYGNLVASGYLSTNTIQMTNGIINTDNSLVINGNSIITPTNPSSIGAFKIQLNNTNGTNDADGSNLFVWRGPGTSNTYLTNNGGGVVNIGTTDNTGVYSSTLQIGSTGNISVSGQGNFTSTNAGTLTNGTIDLKPDGDNGNVIRFGGTGPNADNLIFRGPGDFERMRINGYGHVGIGTSTPTANLEVYGSTIIDDGLTCYSSFRYDSGTSLLGQNPSKCFFEFRGSNLYIYDIGSATTAINNSGGGAVCIGTNSYPSTLQVGPISTVTINGNEKVIAQASTSTNVDEFGIGYDTILAMSPKTAYQGGIASVFFGLNGTSNYPLARLVAYDAQPTSGGSYKSEFMIQTCPDTGTQLSTILYIDSTGTTNINGNLTVGGTSISRVVTSTIGSDPGSGGWTTYLGKYCFVNGDSVTTLTLPVGGDVPGDGTIIVIRNIGTTTTITVNNIAGGGTASILPGKTTSFIYTTSVGPGWYAL